MAEKESGVVVRRPEARRLVWDPWAEFDEVRRHFDGLLNRTFGTLPWGRAFAPAEASYEPPVELVETADEMLLNVYVPGLPQDKITLEVEPERVTVSGTREQPERAEGAVVHLQGMGYGRFCTAISLPAPVVPMRRRRAIATVCCRCACRRHPRRAGARACGCRFRPSKPGCCRFVGTLASSGARGCDRGQVPAAVAAGTRGVRVSFG